MCNIYRTTYDICQNTVSGTCTFCVLRRAIYIVVVPESCRTIKHCSRLNVRPHTFIMFNATLPFLDRTRSSREHRQCPPRKSPWRSGPVTRKEHGSVWVSMLASLSSGRHGFTLSCVLRQHQPGSRTKDKQEEGHKGVLVVLNIIPSMVHQPTKMPTQTGCLDAAHVGLRGGLA